MNKTTPTDPATAASDETFPAAGKNQGPSNNAGYTLADAVPAGTTFVSASPACALASGTVTCTSTGLVAGATDTYTITVHIGAGFADGGSLTNTASIASSATSDPDH